MGIYPIQSHSLDKQDPQDFGWQSSHPAQGVVFSCRMAPGMGSLMFPAVDCWLLAFCAQAGANPASNKAKAEQKRRLGRGSMVRHPCQSLGMFTFWR